MSRKGNLLIIVIFFIYSCNLNNKKNNKSQIFITKFEKSRVYKIASDTVISWSRNNLLQDSSYEGKTLFTVEYKLDSTICINSSKTKMIGTLLSFHGYQRKYFTDGIEEFFGAKINNRWYFWTGGFTPIVRKSFKKQNLRKPLSYKQLHSIVSYGGYLDENGKIREEWFNSKFKGSGMGIYKDRYEYKSNLDGNRIDNEKDFWEYKWKRAGIINWITKVTNDSIVLYNKLNKKQLTDEQKREIGYYISSKMVNELP